MQSESIIEVRNATKKYGKLFGLKDLNFSINKGEVFGLLGANGAGKSTFISLLSTLSRVTSGDILVKGFSVNKDPDKIKKSIGLVPQDIALYPMLSGLDNLNFWAGIYGLSGKVRKERVEEALAVVRLTDRAKDRVDKYSGGMKRRLNIAVALLHHPEILIMDEPTVGVDIQSRMYIQSAMKGLREEGCTIVYASHYTDEVEVLCDRLAILDKGEIKAIGSVRQLQESYGIEKIQDIMLKFIDG